MFNYDDGIEDEDIKSCYEPSEENIMANVMTNDDKITEFSKNVTNKLHYVKVPTNHIVIDFDLKDDRRVKNEIHTVVDNNLCNRLCDRKVFW